MILEGISKIVRGRLNQRSDYGDHPMIQGFDERRTTVILN